jgi:RNA polymerase sigma factor (sigma-70 family)
MAAEPMHLALRHLRTLCATQQISTLPDHELVRRYATERDEMAFAVLVRRHGRMVQSVCQTVLHHQQDAEAAFQATFLVLAAKADSIRKHASVSSWLHGVAYRVALKTRTQLAKRRAGEKRLTVAFQPDPAEELTWQELRQGLHEELTHLPERYRAPLLFCYLEGLTQEEAAHVLGWKTTTLKGRLTHGRELLRRRLTRRGLTLSAGLAATVLVPAGMSQALPVALTVASVRAANTLGLGKAAEGGITASVVALAEGVMRAMLLTKLKVATTLVLICGIVAAGAGLAVQCLWDEKGPWAAQPDRPKAAATSASWPKPQSHNDQRNAEALPPTVPKQEPAAMGKITGRVVHIADGTPVGGANVRLLREDTYNTGPALRTRTNDKGEFTFAGLRPGKHYVWAFHGNLASQSRMGNGVPVDVEPNGTSAPIMLKMRPGVSVRVKVLSQADGKPIAGARVRLLWTDTERDHFTDAKGEVELQALTPETYHVQAGAKDYAAERRAINLGSGQPGALEIKLQPGGSVTGRVQDENGRPLAGVGVNLYGDDQSGVPWDYVETDAAGRYRLDYLPLTRNLQLLVSKLDYFDEKKNFRLDGGKGQLVQLDFILKKRPHGGSVRGVVQDQQGKPIVRAEILNQGSRLPTEARRAKTDAQGNFLLDNVYAGRYGGHRLVVRAKGFSPRGVEFQPGPATQPTAVTVTLEPGHRIKGQVVDEAGKPIRGVYVYFAFGNMPTVSDLGGHTITDAQGRFQFDSLPENSPFAFDKDGYSAIDKMALPLDGDKEVVVTMKSEGVIKGKVVDAATGKPIPRFNVRVTFSPDRQPDEPGRLDRHWEPGEDFVSPLGQFVLKELTAGMSLQLTISADDYRRQVVRRVVARTATEAEPVEIRLTTEAPAKLLTLGGKLLNHRGEAVRGAELRLIVAVNRPVPRDAQPFDWQTIEMGRIDQQPNVLQVQSQTTAFDGSFVFQRVPGGAEIELVYWGKSVPCGRSDHLEKLTEKERTGLVIQAPAPARITGTIDRKVFPQISEIWLSGLPQFYKAVLSADGKRFVMDGLPAGTYELQVFVPASGADGPAGFSLSLGRKSVILEEGKEAKLELGAADRENERTP